MSIRPDQISPASVEAAAKAAYEKKCQHHPEFKWPKWEEVSGELRGQLLEEARAAMAAGLAAWPGMKQRPFQYGTMENPALILPLHEPKP